MFEGVSLMRCCPGCCLSAPWKPLTCTLPQKVDSIQLHDLRESNPSRLRYSRRNTATDLGKEPRWALSGRAV